MANRTLIGQFAVNDMRFRHSKPGYNVLSNLDPERMIFDSAWKDGATVYRIASVLMSGTSVTVNFGETLPYIPFVYHWRSLSSTSTLNGSYSTADASFTPYWCEVTTSSIIFVGSDYDALAGSTFGYIILRPVANG